MHEPKAQKVFILVIFGCRIELLHLIEGPIVVSCIVVYTRNS